MVVKELESLKTKYDLILAAPPWEQSKEERFCLKITYQNTFMCPEEDWAVLKMGNLGKL